MKKESGRNPWIFTKRRKEALKKAQKIHVDLVKLGERARARGMH